MKKLVFLAVLMCPLAGFAQHFVAGVRVTIAPPALRLEVVPQPPSLRHQWVAGYWAWHAGRQVWIEGHWTLPLAPGYVWQPASWENRGGVWFFYEGYWRAADAPDPGAVYQPPPPPGRAEIVETAPPAPMRFGFRATGIGMALGMSGWQVAGRRDRRATLGKTIAGSIAATESGSISMGTGIPMTTTIESYASLAPNL